MGSSDLHFARSLRDIDTRNAGSLRVSNRRALRSLRASDRLAARSLRDAVLASCAMLAMTIAGPAMAQENRAEVIHWWTSGGESTALQEIVKKFEAGGGEWVDNAIAGGQAARTQGINRIVGGNPPTAMQFNTGRQFEEIVSSNLLNSIDDVAKAGDWTSKLPDIFAKAVAFDGTVYAVPLNIHGQNWVFYNTAVLAKAGLEPPKTWGDLIAMGPKLTEAGVIPLAQGGEAWQERTLFNAVLLGEGGRDLYNTIWSTRDTDAVESEDFRRVATVFGELRQFRDPGAPGRTWNLTTNLVVNGEAAFQLMGDWVKGEFYGANMTAGKEFGCVILGADQALNAGGDVFVFPRTDDEGQKTLQRQLAEVMFDSETQIAFSAKKGSMPVRTDADVSTLDICAQDGTARIKAGNIVAQVNILASSDYVGAVDDVVTQFWNTPSMDVDTFVEDFVNAMESAE